MEPAGNPDVTPAATQFAKPDSAEGRDLKRRIAACLRDRVPTAQGICVAVFGSTVAIRGILRSRDDKQLCLECCRQVSGILRVVDELIVADEPSADRDPPVDRGPDQDRS